MELDVKGLNLADVLLAFYDAHRNSAQELGHFMVIQRFDSRVGRIELAQQVIDRYKATKKEFYSIDYIDLGAGRKGLKIVLGRDTVDTWPYEKDAGGGAVERVQEKLATLRAQNQATSSLSI